MAVGTTALSYQMMIEGHYMGAMMNAAARDLYQPASLWADNWGAIIGYVNPKDLQPPYQVTDAREFSQKWQDYFFKKTFDMSVFVNKKMEEIRKKYNERNDIPRVVK